MVCEHKSYGDTAWHPFEYHDRYISLKGHPACSECALFENMSRGKSKPLEVKFWQLDELIVSVSIEKSRQECCRHPRQVKESFVVIYNIQLQWLERYARNNGFVSFLNTAHAGGIVE